MARHAGAGTTTAQTISPQRSSGMPTTARSSTPGQAGEGRLDLGRRYGLARRCGSPPGLGPVM